MEESDGDKVELDIGAKRNQGLSKRKVIVNVIRQVVQGKQTYLDEAVSKGIRKNESKETTIRATRTVVHTRVSVDADDAGVAAPDDIRSKLTRFLMSLI